MVFMSKLSNKLIYEKTEYRDRVRDSQLTFWFPDQERLILHERKIIPFTCTTTNQAIHGFSITTILQVLFLKLIL